MYVREHPLPNADPLIIPKLKRSILIRHYMFIFLSVLCFFTVSFRARRCDQGPPAFLSTETEASASRICAESKLSQKSASSSTSLNSGNFIFLSMLSASLYISFSCFYSYHTSLHFYNTLYDFFYFFRLQPRT
jgi:hypothetical protein